MLSSTLSSVEKERLVTVFGELGVKLILRHIDDLKPTFGNEVATIIELILCGKAEA